MKPSLVYYGDKRLRVKCAPVKEITDEIHALVRDMVDIMNAKDGAGLAAPQVGHAIRLFIKCDYIHHPDGRWSLTPPKVMINPKILEYSEEKETDLEGCLSLPGLRVPVTRPVRVKFEYTNLEGERIVEEQTGYNGRTFFHENDHLNGVLHIDRMEPSARRKIEGDLQRIKSMFKSPI